MSMRSLIEINHDFSFRIEREGFIEALQRYLASGSRENAEELERFGLHVIGMRHHSSNYVIDGGTDGFPPQYLAPPSKEMGNG